MKLITLLLGTFVLGLVAGIFVEDWSSPFKQTQLVRAFPAGGVYNRDFGSDDCVAPTFDENQVYESALGAIEIASQVLTRSRFVSGAKSLMATGFFRDLEDQRSVKVCPPADLYTRLKPVIEDSLYRYFMQYEQLSLASKMPDPRPELVRAVASIAFSQKPHLESDDVAFAEAGQCSQPLCPGMVAIRLGTIVFQRTSRSHRFFVGAKLQESVGDLLVLRGNLVDLAKKLGYWRPKSHVTTKTAVPKPSVDNRHLGP